VGKETVPFSKGAPLPFYRGGGFDVFTSPFEKGGLRGIYLECWLNRWRLNRLSTGGRDMARFFVGVLGFTTIELMVTLTVLVVLIGFAVPSFSAIVAQNRLAAATNDLAAAFSLARQTAVTRNASVALCAGDAVNGCHAPADWNWSRGWLIFMDRDRNGVRDGNESIVHEGSQSPVGLKIFGNTPMRKPIIFSPMGFASQSGGAFSAGTVRVCTPARIQDNARDLVLAKSGRVRVEAVDLAGVCTAP
jgi:type IV fimbrial biogenesis protein FimT